MKKLQSNWLNGVDLKKSSTEGMGAALVGPAFGEVVAKIAGTLVVCKNGHQTTVLEAPDSGRCAVKSCREKLAVKGGAAPDDEPDEDDEMKNGERSARGIASTSKGERHGGQIDGRTIYSERKSSRAQIDSPRQPYVRD